MAMVGYGLLSPILRKKKYTNLKEVPVAEEEQAAAEAAIEEEIAADEVVEEPEAETDVQAEAEHEPAPAPEESQDTN